MNISKPDGYYLFNLLIDAGFDATTAKILTAQSAHETGNFTSRIFRNNKNYFGMKLAKKRRTTAEGELFNHAKFANLEDSVKDIRIYFDFVKIATSQESIERYVDAIYQKNYFEASPEEYKSGMKHFYTLYFG